MDEFIQAAAAGMGAFVLLEEDRASIVQLAVLGEDLSSQEDIRRRRRRDR